MARKTMIKLVDDLDGGEASETVKFGLDGVAYEIDLSADNADMLRVALARFIEAGRRDQTIVRRGRPSAHLRSLSNLPWKASKEQNKAIREWAARKGMTIAARGRIPADVTKQFHAEAGKS